MYCLCIPRHRVPSWWQVCGEWVRSACAAGGFVQDPRELRARMFESDDTLLIVMVLESGVPCGCMVVEMPSDRDAVHVTSVAGHGLPHGWMRVAVEHLVEIARITRRSQITGAGRLGWERRLAPYGFVWDDEQERYVRRMP